MEFEEIEELANDCMLGDWESVADYLYEECLQGEAMLIAIQLAPMIGNRGVCRLAEEFGRLDNQKLIEVYGEEYANAEVN